MLAILGIVFLVLIFGIIFFKLGLGMILMASGFVKVIIGLATIIGLVVMVVCLL